MSITRGTQNEKPCETEITATTVYLRNQIERIETESFTGWEYEEEQVTHEEYLGRQLLIIQELQDISNATFVQLANSKLLKDSVVIKHPNSFPLWDENTHWSVADIARDGDGLYRMTQAKATRSISQSPSNSPDIWEKIEV